MHELKLCAPLRSGIKLYHSYYVSSGSGGGLKLFAIFASFASVGMPKSLSEYLLHFLSKQQLKPMLYKCCSAQLLNNSLDLFYILYLNNA